MIHQLSAETIHDFTVNTLQQQIDLELKGYRIDDRLAWDVLLKASSEYRSISSVCAELDDSVYHNTLRLQLNQRFDVSTLQRDEIAMNATLAALIPQSIRGQAVDVAIDFHDEPYYGKNPENRTYVCRTQAQAGLARIQNARRYANTVVARATTGRAYQVFVYEQRLLFNRCPELFAGTTGESCDRMPDPRQNRGHESTV